MGRKILFITTDQMRYDAIGANGGTVARTPVIDALAAEGIAYDRAQPQNVVCMPSRATMITGQHVGHHGVWMNGVVGRWPEAGLALFDSSSTYLRLSDDSLNIRNVLSIDNPRTFDVAGTSNRFGTEDKFTGANITTSTDAAHTLFVSVPTAATTIANGTALDWRPAAGSAIRTGGTGTTLPGLIGNRVNNYFGGTMVGTTYRGAVEPDVATPWYAGWTVYYRN